MKFGSHLKTATKTVSWRLVGALDTFALSYVLSGGKFGAAVSLVGLEVLTKSIWFYGHERVWEAAFLSKLFGGTSS